LITDCEEKIISDFKLGSYAIILGENYDSFKNRFLNYNNDGPNTDSKKSLLQQFNLNVGDKYPLHKAAID